MTAEPLAGVIWDLDGTLADTEQAHFRSWQLFCRQFGHELTWDEFKPTFGLSNHDVLRGLIRPDLSDAEAETLSQQKEALFRQSSAGLIEPMPGALELVLHLHGLGIPQAIGSSAPPENIPYMLQAVGAAPYFTAVVSRWDVTAGKPAPDIFLAAAGKIGVPSKQCLVLEDAPAGVQAAHAAGMRCVALISSWPEEALAEADFRVSTLSDLIWPRPRYADFAAGIWNPRP
jgi:beta-phosphoglucomutase